MSSTSQRTGGVSIVRGPTMRIWLFTALIAAGATYMSGTVAGLAPIAGRSTTLQWWHLAILFYMAEVSVVHFEFRRNAHSFSLSEIPLVVGLYLANPIAIIVGQLVGSAAALALNRRQPPIKLAFNLSQVALVSAVTILMFRRIVPSDDLLGPAGWAAVTISTLSGLLLADLLIHLVIRTSGGKLDFNQIAEVFSFSAAGAVSNAVLGVIAVQLIWSDPRNAWLSFVAPAVLYVAYRAYASQRMERSRLQAIYLATQRLHASPQIDQAVAAAVGLAAEILDGAAVEVILSTEDGQAMYRTTHADSVTDVMRPVDDIAAREWLSLGFEGAQAKIINEPGSTVAGQRVSQVLAAPLIVGGHQMGVLVVGDRLSDIEGYGDQDMELLAALGGQLSVSLENGKLGDSLTAMTDLKEQLESEMEARDQFVASVSHELRTPLTAIMGLASELWSDHGDMPQAEMGELLGMIAEQSSELAHIIEDLLVAARADAGNLVVKSEPIDLRTEAKSVGDEVSRTANREVKIESSEVSAIAHADPVRVRQIIRNLLTNATRYGGDTICIRATSGAGLSQIVVSDDGEGVPEESVESIFEPYQRAHNARGTTASVGLGLAVARSLARLMHGDLVYRRRGGLTEFALTLPTSALAAEESSDLSQLSA